MSSDPLLQPYTIKNLTLRNRIMTTSHEPAYPVDGMPKDLYRAYHVERAKAGVALTMTAGSAAVSRDSPPVFNNILAYKDEVVGWLKDLTDECHEHGAAVMIQLTHLGRRTRWDKADWLPVVSPSHRREASHHLLHDVRLHVAVQQLLLAFLRQRLRFHITHVALLQQFDFGNQLRAGLVAQLELEAQAQLELAHLARRIQADHGFLALVAHHVQNHLRLVDAGCIGDHFDLAAAFQVALEFVAQRRSFGHAHEDRAEGIVRRLAQLEAAGAQAQGCAQGKQ